MVRHAKPAISGVRPAEPIKVLHQVFLFSRLENHRVEKPRRVGLNVPPTLVIHVEIGSHPPLAVMTRDNLIHKAFKYRLVPANGPKGKRLDPPLASALRVFAAIKPDPERKPAAPEEMASGGGDQRHLCASQRGIEIDAADALQELLFDESFLHPYERIVIVTYRDHHRCLLNKQRPKLLRHSA